MKYFLMPTYGNFLKLKYGLKTKGFEQLKDIKGPAIVFANHVHTLDPFFISARMPFHIRWVAGSYLFKMPFVSHLLRKWVTAIPKTQGRSDLETIRLISKALKENDVVGLFPEGTRTWTGDTYDIVGGTAKLVRLFKVPVVFINIEGGYAKKPRWSTKERKGKVYLNVKRILMPEEIAKMSLAEINQCVEENLIFKHDKWASENPEVNYSGPLSEGIERVFYACPVCNSFSTIRSTDEEFHCVKCNAKAKLDGRYQIHSDEFAFKTISDWHKWEMERIDNIYSANDEKSELFPVDEGILFQMDVEDVLKPISKSFNIRAFIDRLEFEFKEQAEGVESVFYFSDIESMVINAKQTIEFFHKSTRYRFRPSTDRSSLKYLDLYNVVLNKNKEAKP